MPRWLAFSWEALVQQGTSCDWQWLHPDWGTYWCCVCGPKRCGSQLDVLVSWCWTWIRWSSWRSCRFQSHRGGFVARDGWLAVAVIPLIAIFLACGGLSSLTCSWSLHSNARSAPPFAVARYLLNGLFADVGDWRVVVRGRWSMGWLDVGRVVGTVWAGCSSRMSCSSSFIVYFIGMVCKAIIYG